MELVRGPQKRRNFTILDNPLLTTTGCPSVPSVSLRSCSQSLRGGAWMQPCFRWGKGVKAGTRSVERSRTRISTQTTRYTGP
jgi:hypothetical protein